MDDELPQLRVFHDRSKLFRRDGSSETFEEGPPNRETLERAAKIRDALEEGYLRDRIESARAATDTPALGTEWMGVIDRLVDGITASRGRALVGVTVLQLTIKSVEPSQSIRLHKGGARSDDFSWVGGVSMRSLDTSYITPILRREGLISLNASGFMMTRGLAENYPYSILYKAAMRGPRAEWLELVEGAQSGELDAESALDYLLQRLIRRSDEFKALTVEVLARAARFAESLSDVESTTAVLLQHMRESPNAARLLEVAMHSLLQVADERGAIAGVLRPLSQMRSANKKAGNVGDVEICASWDRLDVIEAAWDAKYGHPYLLDQLNELREKIETRADIQTAGFVVDRDPDLREDIVATQDEIWAETGIEVTVESLEGWVRSRVNELELDGETIARDWFTSYTESLCLKRPDSAPLDEPTERWLRDLLTVMG